MQITVEKFRPQDFSTAVQTLNSCTSQRPAISMTHVAWESKLFLQFILLKNKLCQYCKYSHISYNTYITFIIYIEQLIILSNYIVETTYPVPRKNFSFFSLYFQYILLLFTHFLVMAFISFIFSISVQRVFCD